MAGSDSGGGQWAVQYDSVATQLVQAGCDLGEAMGQAANLLNGSLKNHTGADYGATISTPAQYQTAGDDGDADPNHWTETLSPARLPSARAHRRHAQLAALGRRPFEGLLWPDADTGKLRTIGQAWITAGTTIEAYQYSVEAAKTELGTQESPEIPDATAALAELKQHASDLAGGYKQIGQACNDYAKHVDDHHKMIEDELTSFIEWTAGIEIAGGVLAFFTAGISEAAAQAAEAAEVANAASTVVAILRMLLGLAEASEEVAAGAEVEVETTITALEKLIDADVEKALVETGENVGLDALDGEKTAAYEKYTARETVEGKTPKSPEEWQRLKNQIKINKANGDAFEAEMMKADGSGLSKTVGTPRPASSPLPGRCAAGTTQNVNATEAVEVKNGGTPQGRAGPVEQGRRGAAAGLECDVAPQAAVSPGMMSRLAELAERYPKFHDDIGG